MISITGIVADKTYDYGARKLFDLPVVDHELLRPRDKSESIIYMAVDLNIDVHEVTPEDLLYVGSEAAGSSRMFRGDGLRGRNFHHKEMRSGRAGKNLVQHLVENGPVMVLSASGDLAVEQLASNPLLDGYGVYYQHILEANASKSRKGIGHGYALEQLILLKDGQVWDWNSKGADSIPREASAHLTYC